VTDPDKSVHELISRLVAREHELREHLREDDDAGQQADRQALNGIEVALDQCWDLLRQRDARRRSGQDPDQATPRPISQVENYLQ
jgi:hypothetical protein